MVQRQKSTRSAIAALVRALATLGAATALASSLAVAAQEATSATKVSHASGVAPGSATLEAAFWRCDYEATTGGVLDLADATHCSIATETLRQHRFNGDFNAMLHWWRQNKNARHQAIARRSAAAHPAH